MVDEHLRLSTKLGLKPYVPKLVGVLGPSTWGSQETYDFIGEYEGEMIRLPSVVGSAPDTIYLRENRKLMGFE